MSSELWLILLLLLGAALFWRERQKSELAALALRRYCKTNGLQLLSVALSHRRFGRSGLVNCYQFEFSSDGESHYTGQLRLRGNQIEGIDLPPFRMSGNDRSGRVMEAELYSDPVKLETKTMESPHHTLSHLFAQLGLPSDELSIRRFINSHALDSHTLLPEAPFWSRAQADFLRDALYNDSDWSSCIDELDRQLRR